MFTCVFSGKLCIEVTPQSKIVWISESLCIGCGICIKVHLSVLIELDVLDLLVLCVLYGFISWLS